jgi:1,4-dihydroxy-2-naphthoyl-CoA synthase
LWQYRSGLAGVIDVAIHRLLERSAFDPETVATMVAAYERICRDLKLSDDRYAAANEVVAAKVIEVVQTGELCIEQIVLDVVASVHLPDRST